MNESFQFWVGQSSNLAALAKLDRISSATINLKLNDGGSVALTIDASELFTIYFATPLTYCILVYREGTLVWSGPIWTTDESYSGENRKINVTAVGWSELLNHRLTRTQPGYQISTSAITWTNATYESAISGFTTSHATATRDTSVFRTGAGSLLFGESETGPFGDSLVHGTSAYDSTITHTPLSATPTSGKKYRLNFFARGRKTPSDVGCSIPYVEVVQSGTRAALLSLNTLYNSVTLVNNFYNGGYTANNVVVSGAGVSTGTFVQQAIEWISDGTVPTFKYYMNTNPTQSAGANDDVNSWTPSGNTTVGSVPFQAITLSNFASPTVFAQTQNWNGTFTTGKVYKVTLYLHDGSLGLMTNHSIAMYENTTAGTLLGSAAGGAAAISGYSSLSFTFTATSARPLFAVGANYSGTGSNLLSFQYLTIQENASDTDPLVNFDDFTLQEYQGDGIYSNLDAGTIAINLLNKANSDGATKIVPGSVQTTQLRTRTYQQFSNVGKEIKALSDIEAGYDYVVDPATRELDIYNRTTGANFPVTSGQAGVGGWIYSADRTGSLRFDYKTGMDNLSMIRRTIDSSSVVNRLNVQGKYALGFAQDTISQSSYGIFEDLVSLPDVVDATTSSVLPFYANAEIAFRKNPKISYEVNVKTGGNAPKLFIDFNIGDRGVINVASGVLVGGSSVAQTVRIFGVQLAIDSEGNERLSGIQLSA